MLIAGIVASVGMFIPIGPGVPLNGASFLVDPFLVLLGGILGLALKQ